MADSTTGPQKAMRPVSLRASLRLDVRRAPPSSKVVVMPERSRKEQIVKRIFPDVR